MSYLIVDGHLDLAMNALEWNRNLMCSVEEIRESEQGLTDKPDRGNGTVSFPSMRMGRVGLCMATQIARYVKPGNKLPGWKSPHQAWAMTQGQFAWYKAMEEAGEMIQICNNDQLNRHLDRWKNHSEKLPIGYILSLEGADSIVEPSWVERAYENGLRAIGPAHYGPGTYAQGTDASGGMGKKGKELLNIMEKLGIILDVSHLNDQCFSEALGSFDGPVWASHNNCRAFVPHNRQMADWQINELISRQSVIGIALDAWMMVPGWIKGKSTPQSMGISLEITANNIDHICQLAGNALHVGIGSDLDGAFGKEQGPQEVDTIADLQKLPEILFKRGYSETDIVNIMSGNWIRFLNQAWQ